MIVLGIGKMLNYYSTDKIGQAGAMPVSSMCYQIILAVIKSHIQGVTTQLVSFGYTWSRHFALHFKDVCFFKLYGDGI